MNLQINIADSKLEKTQSGRKWGKMRDVFEVFRAQATRNLVPHAIHHKNSMHTSRQKS